MKVSIIISNYNYARYLNAAIESVIAQNYQKFEIIVVDDGSKDNSREVVLKLQEKYPNKIKAIFQENQGQGGAFNTGFQASSGEIIAFLDADDVWKPNKLQQIVEVFQQPEIVGVMHLLEEVDSDGNLLTTKSPKKYKLGEDLAKVVIQTGNAWNFPPTSALSYRRSILEQVFPIDPVRWRIWADGCLIYSTAFLGKIKTINLVLGGYRIHGANNHASAEVTSEQITKALLGVEMTNQYVNEFLENINYPHRVDLSRNLQLRREQYYQQKTWKFGEIFAISRLILGWKFYSWYERIYYLTRFWAKNLNIYFQNNSLYSKKNTKQFAE